VKTGENAIKLQEIEIQGRRLRGPEIGDFFKTGKVTKLT